MKELRDYEAAFDYCRELARPVEVLVSVKLFKLYPSGQAKHLYHKCECDSCKFSRGEEHPKRGRERYEITDPFWNRFQDRRTDRGN